MKKTIFLFFLFFILTGCSANITKKNGVDIDPSKYCQKDDDCTISDVRDENGCLLATGGCDLEAYNKAFIEDFESKIAEDPKFCENVLVFNAYCIPEEVEAVCEDNICMVK